MLILVKGDDIRSGTKANYARHGRFTAGTAGANGLKL